MNSAAQPLPLPTNAPHWRRHVPAVIGVVALHAAALWALQAGLVTRVADIVVPVVMLSEIVSPPAPEVAPAPPPPPPVPVPPPPAPAPAPAPVPQRVVRRAAPAPAPVKRQPVAEPAPAPSAPTPVTAPAPSTPVDVSAAPPSPLASPAPPAPPAPPPVPPRVELPSSDAAHLNNPKPVYPPMSKRLGEQGKVIVRALIGADGSVEQASVRQSSGFDRLDAAALKTAQSWRYAPGTRGGVPVAMWHDIPIIYQLD